MLYRCELHPVYGAVHRDGDIVQQGDVIGLLADGSVALSPCAGRIRIVRSSERGTHGLYAEILPTGPTEKEAGTGPAPPILPH
jgi:hypothetical protein